jgi:hypothetical protein
MKQLIDTILAIPLAKFRNYLIITSNLQPNSLRYSILYYKAINAGFSPHEVIQFNDPLALELKRFNDLIMMEWNKQQLELRAKKSEKSQTEDNVECKQESASKSESLVVTAIASPAEDDRLDLIIKLFQEYDRAFQPNLTKLKEKIDAFAAIYTRIGDGYSAYTLTSLFSAIAFTYSQKRAWQYSYFVPKRIFIFQDEKILDIYASLYEPAELKSINLLAKFDAECRTFKDKLELYIEEYIFSMVVVFSGRFTEEENADASAVDVDENEVSINDTSVSDFFIAHEDLVNVINIRECMTVLETCLYEKGQSTSERLMLFNRVFFEDIKNIVSIGSENVDESFATFKKNILLLFSANALPKNALFHLPVRKVSQTLSAEVKEAVAVAKI